MYVTFKKLPFKQALINAGLLLALLPGAASAQSTFCQINEQIDTAPFVSGLDPAITPDGSENLPYRICNASQLQAVANDQNLWVSAFELDADLDLTGFSGTIGITNAAPFSGSFDGNGHTLSNYAVNAPGQDFVGLFGYVREGAIEDLNMTNVDVTGNDLTGALIGYLQVGTVRDVSVQGKVNGHDKVGLAIGSSSTGSIIVNASANGSVTANNWVGGLIGYAQQSEVSDASASGHVVGSNYIGGLIGGVWHGSVENAQTSGSATTTGGYAVGGLVGNTKGGAFRNTHSSAGITGTPESAQLGGLIGKAHQSFTENASASGHISGMSRQVGGLIGDNFESTIQWSHATGTVWGEQCVGGLAGYGGTVKYSYSTGRVYGGSVGIGGLTGCYIKIYDSYSHSDVIASGANGVGGLSGLDPDIIERAFSTGNVGTGNDTGGAVGKDYNTGSYISVFWNVENNDPSLQDTASGDHSDIDALTTEQMQTQATYLEAGYDLTYIWQMVDGASYPTLKDFQQ